ncbi:MAG: hypothetical protein HY924_10830 [Elusimicrobia bacterium]|nr:hypothetical protein [Elusimicrobiota bacterium]
MKTLVAALAAVLCAAPFAAANENLTAGLPSKLDIPKFQLKQAGPPPQVSAVESTIVAMNDGAGVGAEVVEFLKATGVRIEFRKQAAPSSLEAKPGAKAVIALSQGLPLYPRILAPYITREASKLMLDGMVESAEKEYMKLSMTVRVWLELGGSSRSLPEIETINHFKDAALADSFKIWLDGPGSELALDRIGKKTGQELIPVMQDRVAAEIAVRRAGDPTRSMLEKLLAGLEEDNKRFLTFHMAEREWRMSNDFRLR